MTAILEMPTAAPVAAPPASSMLQTARTIGFMFLPFIAYQLGEYLVAHWEPARQLEHLVAPYAFSASLLVGLVVGMAQIVWTYAKTRELSSYVLQQLGWLLAFTFVPLYFGHFVHQGPADPVGYNVLGLVGMGIAAVYAVDFATGGHLMMAFPKHFSPETAKLAHLPRFRRVLGHIEFAMVAMFALKGAFLVFGNRLLPHATYLLVLPFFAKGLLYAFITFSVAYPQWARRQVKLEKAATAAA
jgi:hypothetical protein